MKRRFLVIVRAGDRSQHPQWLAQSEARNWDLVVHYYGDDPQRYPAAGDGVVRIDSKGPKWPALQQLLRATRDAWREYDFIWIPDEDLAANGADINRMFELMTALNLELAQPSLAWDSDVEQPLTLHNPNFAVRFSSFVTPTAPCFSRALLERVLPTFAEEFAEGTGGTRRGETWPGALQSPATQCAILDRIQVTLKRRGADAAPRFATDAIQLSYGALDRDARRHNLFDAESGDFVFRLCDGYLGRMAGEPALLGALFAAHAKARAEYLCPPAAATNTTTAPAPDATPAANADAALGRFKSALAAAAANSAGRVAATTPA